MAGHSKWATTKRHKAAVDAKRGKLFSMIGKELTIAARDGGGDPEFNPRLRTCILKAKQANMPADNIDRAIKKGTGELAGATIEELVYEGYAPGGVGLIIEVTTDNKNRSAAEVRSSFTKYGGKLADPGALAFNFQRIGQFLVSAEKTDEDTLMEIALESGAEDVINNGDHFEVRCGISEFHAVSQALSEKEIEPESAELIYHPNNLVQVSEAKGVSQVLKLVEVLDDLDDVKAVHANYDIDDSLLNAG